MSLAFFYKEDLEGNLLVLDEDSSKHVVQVLRKQKGANILLTDGKGRKALTEIVDDNRKRCAVRIIRMETEAKKNPPVTVAVSLIKNSSRFEWFLEKATEIGVSEIIPLLCERTEKEKFRLDRMQQIMVSAMLQSQQCWLPVLQEPMAFEKLLSKGPYGQKLVAHCLEEEKSSLAGLSLPFPDSSIILIGPEGDFSPAEIKMALESGYRPVTLGNSRLRTETAALVAATLLCIR